MVTWSRDTAGCADLAVQVVAHLSWSGSYERATGITEWAERAVPAAERSTPGFRASALAAAAQGAWVRGDVERAPELAVAGGRAGRPPPPPPPPPPPTLPPFSPP